MANDPEGAPQDWDKVFAGYTAAVDNPACCVWRELAAFYPDAKIVLTLHPKGAEAWYESTIDTIYFTENRWQFKVIEFVTPFGREFGDMSRKRIWNRAHRGTMNDRARAIAEYNRHIDDVKAAFPPGRLLVFTVDRGWDTLCAFLGVPVPDGAFPNVNDRAEIKRTVAIMTRGAYAILAAAGLIVVAAAYAAWRLLG